MSKHTHTVVAEMVDVVTGERKFPGEGFTPHDDDQAERLIKADCLKEGAPKVDKTEAAAAKEASETGAAEAKPAAPKPAAAKPAAAKPAAKA